MAKIFLDQLSRIIDRATSGRIGDVTVECKHFFSGAAVYADGRICISLTPVGFAIKLPEGARNLLLNEKGAKPLCYFPKGPIKEDYVVLPSAMLKDVKALRRWVKVSVEY